MPKRRGADDKKRLDIEEVLAGRIKVGAVELLDLIHRVNPTGRELDSRATELRYRQKARLQSLLVRRFGAELTVALDPASVGTVSLLHGHHGRDGCHALLDTLDEDARAWVQHQLDLGPPSSEAPPAAVPAARPSGRKLPAAADEDEVPSSKEASSPESMVRRADEALAAYDFERARGHLEQAVAASAGAAGPAAALLVLLVETLGDDAAALALQPSLGRAALAHADVRALLALAAARSGDAAEAAALLRGASEQRAAEVSAALASRALEAGKVEQASAHLAELRKRDPAHGAVVRLAGEIAQHRAAARAPLEAALAALVAAGQKDEAEKKAAELLARWPESEAGRRVLRAAEEQRRLAQEAAERRAREIEAALQAEREAAQVEQVRAQLAAPDPREGLLAWLELDPALRRRVAAPGAAELCRWLELTPARAAPPARVEAVLAIGVARQRLARDPQGAIEALAANEATLERVPEARRIVHEARAEIAARQAARAREAVAAARRDLAGGDAAAAIARLDAPLLRHLDDEEQAAAEVLRAEAAWIVLREKRVAEVSRLRLRAQLFEARDLADALLAEAPPDERPRWEQERAAIQDEIQRAFRVEAHHEPSPFGAEAVADATQTMMEPPVWLTEDGRTLVLVEGHERWLWIQLVDVERRMVRTELVLRTPEPMGSPVFHVLGSTAWLISDRGPLLAIDVARLTVELFRSAREIVSPGHHVGGAALAADSGASGPRYHWVLPADGEGSACPVQVIDLETRRVVREVPEVIRLSAIVGTREARIACFKSAGLILHEDRGVPLPGGRFPRQDVNIVFATVHPSGEGLVAAGTAASAPWQVKRPPAPGSRRKQRQGAPRAGEARVAVLVDLAAGPARTPWVVGDLGEGTLLGLASSRDTGLCAVILVGGDLVWELLVARPTGGTFELVHRTEVPAFTTLLRDAGARRLFHYSRSPLIFAPVGSTAPERVAHQAPPSPWISDMIDAPPCLGSSGPRAELHRAVAESVKTMHREAIGAVSRGLQRDDKPEKVVERVRALAATTDLDAHADEKRLRGWLRERHPDDAHVCLLHADEKASLGRWDEVRDLLAPCSQASFAGSDDEAQHLCHLRALAALHLGDVEGARAHAAEAAKHPASCRLQALAALLQPRPDPQVLVREEAAVAEAPPLLTQLVWALHEADGCLAAGDPEGALAALRRFVTLHEVQTQARRAEAWLALAPRGRQRIAKIMDLARLLEAHGGGWDGKREELPVPAAWDRSRLDDVARRAADWLEAEGKAPGDER
jgi:hypothetical protein